jgi:hypothetical protein
MKVFAITLDYKDLGMRLTEVRLAMDHDPYEYRLSKNGYAIKFSIGPNRPEDFNGLLTMCTYRLKLKIEYPDVMLLADEDDHGNGD